MAEGTATAPAATIIAPPGAPAGDAPATPAPEQKAPLLAGKYADQAGLEKGIREARKAAGFEVIPDKLPIIGEDGLFADTAAAEREYKRLDQIINAKKPDGATKPPALTIGEEAKGGEKPPEDASVNDILDKAGIKFEEAEAEFTKNGKLSDEQLKAIRKNHPWMSHNIAVQLAKAELSERKLANIADQQSMHEAASAVGGMEQLDALVKNAGAFVPKDQQPELQKMLNNPKQRVLAVRMLKQMHAEHIGAGGAAPMINGQMGGSGASAITTVKQYKELERRYTAGETHLWDLLASVDPNTLKL